MSNVYTIKGFPISAADEKIVRTAKFDYIQRLNFSGTYYQSIRYVSGMFNEIFELFNKEEEKTFQMDNKEISSFDVPKFHSYAESFYKDMKDKNVSPEIYEYFRNFIVEYVTLLDKISIEIRQNREKETQQA